MQHAQRHVGPLRRHQCCDKPGPYRFRAKRLFGLASVDEAFPGAVTVLQRFDSALRLNVHAHTLSLDGVYVRQADMHGETLSFLRLPAPTEDEVREVAERTARRVISILKKRGRSIEGLSNGEEGGDVDRGLGRRAPLGDAKPQALTRRCWLVMASRHVHQRRASWSLGECERMSGWLSWQDSTCTQELQSMVVIGSEWSAYADIL